ncbi:hypothetical protein SAMN03159391_01320 [Pseudomonas sp. NFACC37-1]|nr:hypothetical protein SAMN03159391_01320 [Pseudomonas sp. NFACC37-1]
MLQKTLLTQAAALNLWRGDLSPLAAQRPQDLPPLFVRLNGFQSFLGLLRSPAGINPLATMADVNSRDGLHTLQWRFLPIMRYVS